VHQPVLVTDDQRVADDSVRPAERVQRLRRCAELAIAGAPWKEYPGIG